MRILITGGSGDLGQVLIPQILTNGDVPVNLDLAAPSNSTGEYVEGSILDRQLLEATMTNVDAIVHIAAWHGIHESRKEKDATDFWDLNVTGTFNVLEFAARAGVKKFVYMSSTSIGDWPAVYAHSKLLCEDLMRTYSSRHNMRIVTLRPRAFIPATNTTVYSSFAEWASWYWQGAVHINDVAQAVLKSLEAVNGTGRIDVNPLTIDGLCDFTKLELQGWDRDGSGSTFKQRFGEEAYALAVERGLNPSSKPKILGYADAERLIGYRPEYGFASLLRDLASNSD